MYNAWKGSITLGLISVPVKLYTASDSKDLAFTNVHETCGTRVKTKTWCPTCNVELMAGNKQRVYEYAKNDYVPVSEQDLAELPVPSLKVIELSSFVNEAEIDPILFEKTYFVEPEAVGAKPYTLLLRALRERKVAAVAKISMRNRENLALLRVGDGVLMLHTLYYADEVRSLHVPEAMVSAQEVQMATALVDALHVPFDLSTYHDSYREAALDMIERKHSGGETASPIPETAAAPVSTSLLDALRASLELANGQRQQVAS